MRASGVGVSQAFQPDAGSESGNASVVFLLATDYWLLTTSLQATPPARTHTGPKSHPIIRSSDHQEANDRMTFFENCSSRMTGCVVLLEVRA
jgi:hypothetical protein